jgi:hypothetical protein
MDKIYRLRRQMGRTVHNSVATEEDMLKYLDSLRPEPHVVFVTSHPHTSDEPDRPRTSDDPDHARLYLTSDFTGRPDTSDTSSQPVSTSDNSDQSQDPPSTDYPRLSSADNPNHTDADYPRPNTADAPVPHSRCWCTDDVVDAHIMPPNAHVVDERDQAKHMSVCSTPEVSHYTR